MAQDWHRLTVNWNPWRWNVARRHARFLKGLLGLGIVVLTVRSLPYLAPIRASDLVQTQQAAEFVDRNGLPLGTVLTRDQDHTVSVSLAQVSPQFLQAIVAAEDQRFYQHGALDERAIVRSLLEALQAKQIVSGASTITMQLARMLDGSPRTAQAKLQEIWTSWRLSAGMSKAEILQAYLNRLPMGSNIYGVEAASRIYFGIPASDLTLAQASLLAAIPNDPNRLNPYDHLLSLKNRQVYVLDRMVQDGYITRAQSDRAYTEATALQSRQQGIIAAPHFLFWLADQLPANHPAQVRTTLDRPLQQFVETQVLQVIRSLAPHNAHHAAVLVLDNPTGEVLAYVGSPDYFARAQLGQNDGVQALRQPGSTLKPFLYQLALENRTIQPNTILADVPTRYAIPGARLYSPSDYSETFQGPVRVRLALANSLNVPAVKILEKVGVGAFLDRLHQLGFSHLTQPPEHYGLGLTLGSGEVSLWELAQAYLTLARQGKGTELRVRSMESTQSTLNPELRTPNSPSTWRLVTDMLSDRHARARAFGVDSLLTLPFSAAVKTGTSSDYRDTWTVGFTTNYTVAVWVGNFDSAPMQKVSGVMGAAPLWNRIMLHLHEQQEPKPFQAPTGLVQRPICAVSGARPTPACPAVVQEYLFPEDLAAYEKPGDRFFPTAQGNNSASTQLKLPAEYNEWLARQPKDAISSTAMGLRIVSPRSNDVFVIGKNDASQRLEFKLAGASKTATEWRLNGQPLTTSTSSSFFWKPQAGTWTLQVKQGQQTDQIRFEVQTAEAKPTRKGFSFAPK
ncbi:penicillin-binding protein 1C [Phormidium sp. CLA17]|uniref:penicillin-binding protein 1C n=1 Tax=Leptolyngbya sp. Cla-17 TaxID=2803751 RepID=UPI001490D9C2|nr:penicillin-binding protein 1C [Leptolyngbya sp. Cla-17]MBM0740664.1 penicillin-binding protein 1C [Leptolyngbya sp. Cla-17]